MRRAEPERERANGLSDLLAIAQRTLYHAHQQTIIDESKRLCNNKHLGSGYSSTHRLALPAPGLRITVPHDESPFLWIVTLMFKIYILYTRSDGYFYTRMYNSVQYLLLFFLVTIVLSNFVFYLL